MRYIKSMVDQLISVDSDKGPVEPIPVTIMQNGAMVDFSGIGSGGGGGSADPAVATRLGDTSGPATGTVNQRLGLINTTLGAPYQAGGALPLPNGAATASGVAAVVTALGTPLQAGGAVSVSNFPSSQAVTGTFFQATQPVSAASLPLPSGAATSALQTSMGTTLSSIDGKSGPSSAAAAAIVPTVGQGITSLLLKASAGNFYSASITAGATAGFLIAYNATSAPASGATLTSALVLNQVAVNANGFASLGGNPVPDRFGTGIVLLFSTSLSTYTVPTNPAVFMRGSAL
jgi:hypothetical protein